MARHALATIAAIPVAPTMKGNPNTMSSDITTRMAEQEAKLAADAAALADHADAVMKTVNAWKASRDDRSLDLVALPAAAMVKNHGQQEAWERLVAAADARGLDRALLDAFTQAAIAVNSALATRLDYAGAVEATALAAALKPAAAASAFLPYDPDVIHALTTAVAAYETAEATYQSALRDQASRDNPASNYRGGRGGSGRGSGRGINPESWEAKHGWYFHATCDICGKVVTSRSNIGSFQNDLAKHAGSHVLGDDGKPRDRIFQNDVNPDYAAQYDAMNVAIYAVADGAPAADGGRWHIVQVREIAAA